MDPLSLELQRAGKEQGNLKLQTSISKEMTRTKSEPHKNQKIT
jgi:hypothetical protein